MKQALGSVALFLDVCRAHGVGISEIGIHQSAYMLHFGTHTHIMIDKCMGLNNESVAKICKDKFYHYSVLSPVVSMPKTMSFVDPDPAGPYVRFSAYTHINEIVPVIRNNFELPVIVKRNSGSTGEHVFLCHNDEEIVTALEAIYSKHQLYYDHVALAQTYIRPRREYRVVVFDGQIELAYLKDNAEATFAGNLSPLHWQNASAHVISDTSTLEKFAEHVKKILNAIPLVFVGLDFIEDESGQMWLIEANSSPGFSEYLKYCEPEPLTALYQKVVAYLLMRGTRTSDRS